MMSDNNHAIKPYLFELTMLLAKMDAKLYKEQNIPSIGVTREERQGPSDVENANACLLTFNTEICCQAWVITVTMF